MTRAPKFSVHLWWAAAAILGLLCAGLYAGIGRIQGRQRALLTAIASVHSQIHNQESVLSKLEAAEACLKPYYQPLGVLAPENLTQRLHQLLGGLSFQDLRVVTVPGRIVHEDGRIAVHAVPIRLSFTVARDALVWQFLGRLNDDRTGLVLDELLVLEKVSAPPLGMQLKGTYHFSWFIFVVKSRGEITP